MWHYGKLSQVVLQLPVLISVIILCIVFGFQLAKRKEARENAQKGLEKAEEAGGSFSSVHDILKSQQVWISRKEMNIILWFFRRKSA